MRAQVLDLEARITKRQRERLERVGRKTGDNDANRQQQSQSQPAIGSGKWEFHLTEPKYKPKAQVLSPMPFSPLMCVIKLCDGVC